MNSTEIYSALEGIRKALNKRPDKEALAKKLDNPNLPEKGRANIQEQLDNSDANIKKIIAEANESLERLKKELSLDELMVPIADGLFELMVTQQTIEPDARMPAVTLPYNSGVYNTMLGYAKLMYLDEKNGIAKEHAYKLATIFDSADTALSYLDAYRKANPSDKQLMHNACNFALPQGQLDWDTWRVLAAKNLDSASFRGKILPQACEIEETIRASSQGKNPTKEDVKTRVDEISKLNSQWKKLNAKHGGLSEEQTKRFEALTKEVASKRLELTGLGVPFSQELTLVSLEAYRERNQQKSSKAYKYFLEHGLSKKDFTKFFGLNRNDAGQNIPDVRLDGKELGRPGYYMMKVSMQDEMQAARAACFGKLTACCQSLSGEVGEPCAIHGLTSPNGGFYVLCKGDANNPKVEDELVAQSWTWRSQSGAVVFDSVEITRRNIDIDMVKNFYQAMAEKMVDEGQINKVACGASSGVSSRIGVAVVGAASERFVQYTGYCDSRRQRILYDKDRPYYTYDISDKAKKQVREIIADEATYKVSLLDNNLLISILNGAILVKDEAIIRLIKAQAKSHGQTKAYEDLISNMHEYVSGNMNIERACDLASKNLLPSSIFRGDGQTPLHLVASIGHTGAALQLIENKADVNAQDATGSTALHYAAKNRRIDIVLKLIENKADLGVRNHCNRGVLELGKILKDLSIKQRTALFNAVQNNLPDIIKSGCDLGQVLQYLSVEQRTVVFNALKDKLPGIIKSGYEFWRVLQYLSVEQRTVAFNALQSKLRRIVSNVKGLGNVLRCLSVEQCKVTLNVFQDKLPNIFKSGLKCGKELEALLERLSPEQRPVVCDVFQDKAMPAELTKPGLPSSGSTTNPYRGSISTIAALLMVASFTVISTNPINIPTMLFALAFCASAATLRLNIKDTFAERLSNPASLRVSEVGADTTSHVGPVITAALITNPKTLRPSESVGKTASVSPKITDERSEQKEGVRLG
jgi:hypothetical protein